MKAPSSLHVVEEGDHSLAVKKRWLREHHTSQDDVDRAALDAIRKFL
jgi:hypothetical protein